MIFERFATKRLRGANEVIDAASLFVLAESKGDCDLPVGLDPGSPELVINVNSREGHGTNGVIPRRRLREQHRRAEHGARYRLHFAFIIGGKSKSPRHRKRHGLTKRIDKQ